MPERRTLTELDEWPRHQTLDTFDVVANPSPGWSDGYWFCIGDPDGQVNLITAIRLYHNTNVIDAYAIVSTDEGRQYNVRASRRLRPQIDDIEVGPFWQKIVRGLRTIQFGCRENSHGVSFDIEWESAAPPHDEAAGARYFTDGRLVAERSNYVQVGDVSGTISIGDREWRFGKDDGWAGARDHSWGMGGTGMGDKPNPYVAPPLEPRPMGWGGPGMRHWALVKLPERSIYYAFLLNSDGTFSASGTGAKGGGEINSRVDYAYESEKPGWAYSGVSVQEHEWVDGFPRLHRGAISLTRPDDGIDRFQIEVVSKPIYMQGGGYWGGWNDGLGRGVFRGESLVEGEVWDVSHPTRVYDLDGREIPQKPGGSYAEVFARYTNLDDPDEVGLGMLEAVIMGEYGGIKA